MKSDSFRTACKTFAFIYTAIAASTFAQESGAITWKDYDLQGSVNKISTEAVRYEQKFGKWVETSRKPAPSSLSQFVLNAAFSREGLLQQSLEYNDDGTLSKRKDISYQGKLPSEYDEYDSTGELLYKEVYQYSDDVRERELVYNTDGSLNYYRVLLYDNDGNPSGTTVYDSSDQILRKWVYTYVAKDQLESYSGFEKDGSLFEKRTFRYDSKGNRRKLEIWKVDGTLDSEEDYVYDSAGHLVEVTGYDASGKLNSKLKVTFAKSGNITLREHYDGDGKPDWRQTFAYDKVGNAIKIEDAEMVNKFGKSYFEPAWTLIRSIAYY